MRLPLPPVNIISLGCPRNLYDSEKLAVVLEKRGFRIRGDLSSSPPPIVILNTCAFIKEAQEETIDYLEQLLLLKAQKRIRKIVVMGCLARRYGRQILKFFPQIDALYDIFTPLHLPCARRPLSKTHYAYLKISEGCSNNCSYCVLPRIRGRYRSRTKEDIVAEAKWLDRKGVKELIIVGLDTTLWGKDLYGRGALALLLKAILRETRIPWVRVLYTHPLHIDRPLLELMKREERICRYIDLPLQHIDDRILERMGRNMKRRQIVDLLKEIRDTVPGIFIRTTFIVGFPGETEQEFGNLMQFIQEYPFERMGCFMYSREEKTRAYYFKSQVHYRVKKRRFDMLMSVQKRIVKGLLEKKVLDRRLRVLVERKAGMLFTGRTEYDSPEIDGEVFVRQKSRGKTVKPKIRIGDIIETRITGVLDYDLEAEII